MYFAGGGGGGATIHGGIQPSGRAGARGGGMAALRMHAALMQQQAEKGKSPLTSSGSAPHMLEAASQQNRRSYRQMIHAAEAHKRSLERAAVDRDEDRDSLRDTISKVKQKLRSEGKLESSGQVVSSFIWPQPRDMMHARPHSAAAAAAAAGAGVSASMAGGASGGGAVSATDSPFKASLKKPVSDTSDSLPDRDGATSSVSAGDAVINLRLASSGLGSSAAGGGADSALDGAGGADKDVPDMSELDSFGKGIGGRDNKYSGPAAASSGGASESKAGPQKGEDPPGGGSNADKQRVGSKKKSGFLQLLTGGSGRGSKRSAKEDLTPEEKQAMEERRIRMAQKLNATAKATAALMSIQEDQKFREKVFGRLEDEQGEDDHAARRAKYLVFPNTNEKAYIDVVFVFCVFWVIFRAPYTVAFVNTTSTAVWVMDQIIATLLLIDIGIGFRTVYSDDGELITNPNDVARGYLRGWFSLDFIASFPYLWVLEGTGLEFVEAFSYLQMLRLLRFSRLRSVEHTLIDRLEISESGQHVMRLFKLAFYVGLVAHVGACSWFFVARVEGHGPDSWTTQYSIEDKTPETQYLSSLYWAFTTLTTVGYGDIAASTNNERAVALAMICVGAVVYAFVVGKMSALSHDFGFQEAEFRRKSIEMTDFVKYFNPGRDIRHRLRKYYQRVAREHPFFTQVEFSSDMSPHLRRDVALAVHAELLQTVPIFKFGGIGFQATVAQMLQPVLCVKDEYVLVYGEASSYMYFVKHGIVSMVDSMGYVTMTLQAGSFFGETMVLDGDRAPYSVRTKTDAELLVLSEDDMATLLSDFPDFEDTVRKVASLRGQIKKRRGSVADVVDEASGKDALRGRRGSSGEVRQRVPPPPFVRTWGDIRHNADFSHYYEQLLGRSRAMQAAEYVPKPRDLSEVEVPDHVMVLTELLAQNSHEVWAAARIAQGWTWGPSRDNVLKKHPDLLPWESLTDEARSYDYRAAISDIKIVFANGWTIFMSGDGPLSGPFAVHDGHVDWEFGTPAEVEGETYTPRPFPTESVEVSTALEELVTAMASDSHEQWAASRMDAGWTWGPTRDDGNKKHNCLLPYRFLTPEEQSLDRAGVESTIKLLVGMGFRFEQVESDTKEGSGTSGGRGAAERRAQQEKLDNLTKDVGMLTNKMRGLERGIARILRVMHTQQQGAGTPEARPSRAASNASAADLEVTEPGAAPLSPLYTVTSPDYAGSTPGGTPVADS